VISEITALIDAKRPTFRIISLSANEADNNTVMKAPSPAQRAGYTLYAAGIGKERNDEEGGKEPHEPRT